jgi:hypothetical protein
MTMANTAALLKAITNVDYPKWPRGTEYTGDERVAWACAKKPLDMDESRGFEPAAHPRRPSFI